MSKKPRLSRSVEDYLKAIYVLSERGTAASTSAVAEVLDIQPGSVSGMVKRLAEAGYVEHAPYRGVRLTAAGTREALRIVRRHRVIETYLHLRLGYSWEEVHVEAERLEHAASDDLVDRMAVALENPSYDPHGSPIPTRGGQIEAVPMVTLAEAPVDAAVAIREVRDEDPERLRYMEARGLLPGVRVTIQDRQPFEGPITVIVGGPTGTTQVLGYELATRIHVVYE